MYDETIAGDKAHIWLRYTAQFTTNGRTHTIEMGIPVPVGASAELREQLIREAEAGMDQLSRHVDQRVNQMLQRTARPQSTTTPATTSHAVSPASPTSQPTSKPPASIQPVPTTSAPVAAQANMHAATPTPAAPPPEKPESAPPARSGIGANMLVSPNQPGDVTGNMKLSHFILFIRENWGMAPKEAMDVLQLKTLNGLNYREVLKELQAAIAERGTQGTVSTTEKPSTEIVTAKLPAEPPSTNRTTSGPDVTPISASPAPIPLRPAATTHGKASLPSVMTRSSTPARPFSEGMPPVSPQSDGAKIPVIPIRNDMVRDVPPVYGFQEEEENEEDLVADLDEIDFENGDLRLRAQEKLDKLRDTGGSMAVSPSRLTVLQNVIGDQISETQLQQLIRTVWNVASTRKLKVDQAEVLISWAKEDDFENEVRGVLALLEEEDTYAGSDR